MRFNKGITSKYHPTPRTSVTELVYGKTERVLIKQGDWIKEGKFEKLKHNEADSYYITHKDDEIFEGE